MAPPIPRLLRDRRLTTLGIILLLGVAGCDTLERAGPQPRAARADRSIPLDVPQIMRGTVAAETIVLGYNPVIVRGYGLVVGLGDTGSLDIPPTLRAHMIAEISRRGFGRESTGWGHVTPESLLDSTDTAVVIVEGVVPPGAVGRNTRIREPGTRFDIRVFADPRTGTTSLEGGRLYTSELRPVVRGEVLPPTGSHQARVLAEAAGPIFINPFAEPGAIGRDSVNRTIGRIMNGGEVVEDIPIKLRLATPSHARAELIQNSVNGRFPQEPGQRDPTARGETGESIRVYVPPSFRDNTDDFIELLRHTTIRQAGAEAVAASVKRVVERDPATAYAATWRWRALGKRALPVVRTVYDFPEILPRMAALNAGAALDDALVIAPLLEMMKSDDAVVRREAVALLGDMRLDPRIDLALRALQSDPEIDIRLAAYEAQVRRADPSITRYLVPDKFILDVVASEFPMVYITQIGQPRIAIFGEEVRLERPLVFDAWSGRLMLQSSSDDPELVEVYFRTDEGDAIVDQTSRRLDELLLYLAHDTTIDEPAPGLGLDYGETVGAIYALWRAKNLQCDFKAQQDRVQAAIRRSQDVQRIEARPEFSDPDYDFLDPAGGAAPDPVLETLDSPETAAELERLAAPPPVGGS